MRLIDETAYQDALAKIPMGERFFVKAVETAQDMPTIDAEPVVHCGDCKFRCDFTDGHCECRRWPNILMSYQRVDPQFDFCSYGEKEAT